MPRITVVFSLIFIALGLGGYFLTGGVHKTALIPAAIGVVLLILGLLGNKENLRMHVMHAAVLVGLLAFLGTARGLAKLPAAIEGTAARPGAVYAQSATAVLALVYIVLAVRSFIAARRARTTAA
jgi:hypothetical protein